MADGFIFTKISEMKCLYLTFAVLTAACYGEGEPVDVVGKLPHELKECSGIAYEVTDGTFWAVNDAGNENTLYRLNARGSVIDRFRVDGVENNDWEDVTRDDHGNVYIGDFGNNDNERRNLAIYKIAAGNPVKVSAKISFEYPEQAAFPPAKKALLYDCEAFLIHADSFYLFTKNRSKGFDGTLLIYKVPMVAGHHKAVLVGKFKTCGYYRTCAITSAAISPDGQKVVLLTGGSVWLFEDFEGDDFTSGSITELKLGAVSQKEAVTFINEDELFLADENNKKGGGNLYRTSIARLKNAN